MQDQGEEMIGKLCWFWNRHLSNHVRSRPIGLVVGYRKLGRQKVYEMGYVHSAWHHVRTVTPEEMKQLNGE